MKEECLTRKQRKTLDNFHAYLSSGVLRPGDQLPPFPELARKLGISVTLLRRVIPLLETRGEVTVLPRKGVFLREMAIGAKSSPSMDSLLSFNAPRAAASGARIRFYCAEEDFASAGMWTEIVQAYERTHPETTVSLSLVNWGDAVVAPPDVLLLAPPVAAGRADGFVDWVERGAVDAALFTPGMRSYLAHMKPKNHLPFSCASFTVFANKQLLSAAGLYEKLSERPTPCELLAIAHEFFNQPRNVSGRMYGLLAHNSHSPLRAYGTCSAAPEAVREETDRYLRLLARTPPPLLISFDDVKDDVAGKLIPDALTSGGALFVLSGSWCGSCIDRSVWETRHLRAVDGAAGDTGIMGVYLNKDAGHPEACKEFAAYLIGDEAQDILAAHKGMIPVMRRSAERHPEYHIFADAAANGWYREQYQSGSFGGNLFAIFNPVAQVRSGRMRPADALDRLLATSLDSSYRRIRASKQDLDRA